MPATVTLTALKNRALRRADMVSSHFVDTTAGGELETYIQDAARELYDIIVKAYGEDYYYATSTVNTVANTATIAVPTNFYKLLGVDTTCPGATDPVALQPFNWNERNIDVHGGWAVTTPRYRLRANTIWFWPTPEAIYPVTIHYVPTMTAVDDGANVFDGINGWDEYIVLSTAIKCLAREESDTSQLEGELARCRQRIEDMAPPRDIGKPHRVTDVMADAFSGWDDL